MQHLRITHLLSLSAHPQTFPRVCSGGHWVEDWAGSTGDTWALSAGEGGRTRLCALCHTCE